MSVSLESLEELLDRKFNEFVAGQIAPLRESVDGVNAAINFMSRKYDELLETVKTLEEKNKKIQVENVSLRSQLLDVKNDLKQQKDAINEYEQYSRRDCLELSGIPLKPRESTNQIVMGIAEEIGVEIAEEDISVSHRLPSRNRNPDRPPVIIAKFVRRDTKERLYRARKALWNKTTRDLGFQTDNRIYISESLTQKNRDLFKKCLQVKKTLKYKFIWTNSGRVYLRKDERPESRALHVASESDLQKLVGTAGIG